MLMMTTASNNDDIKEELCVNRCFDLFACDHHLRCAPFVGLGRRTEIDDDIWVVHHDGLTARKLKFSVPGVCGKGIFVLTLKSGE